ncbi:MAG TPA: serine/threonine protein kinase, partial [Aigarchaeota archaeon]|nr:serine/threonine protein kinase [Aigarchaeota archaeon]
MARELWSLYRSLDRDAFRVLRAIESYMNRYEYVPAELVEKRAGLPPSRISRALKELVNEKIVRRRLGNVSGYTLTFRGLDLL